MIPGSLARRYARALLHLASSPDQRDKFTEDLQAFADLTETRDSDGIQVQTVLTSERFPLEQRRALLDTLLGRLQADPTLGKFLDYVLQRQRMDGITQIARAYRRLADEAAGRMRATITSAQPLSPDAVQKLTQALERATGKQVIVKTGVDPELIGGLVTHVGSFVLDGSIRKSLQEIRASMR